MDAMEDLAATDTPRTATVATMTHLRVPSAIRVMITSGAMDHRDRFAGRFEAVLVAAQGGDVGALSELFTTLSPVVAGYLRLQGSQEPDDLTSEVFVGVLRNIGTFTGDEAKFRAWLFTIAHRRLLDERRRLVRRPPPEPLEPYAALRAADDVEAEAGRRVSDDRVWAICRDLSPDQRDVLLMRLLGGLTLEECAATLGKTLGAVKALQRRGFAAVARRLEQEKASL
jgi:RNA polymerase sigma factor (sigma-70 family)